MTEQKSHTSSHHMKLEETYGAHNYHPIPVVLSEGKGIFVYDVDGKKYYDFLSAYSSVNQGHCHPRILETLIEQAKKLTLCSRAFYTDSLGICEQYLCQMFGYDKVLMMNTGAEANESAYKLCRKWGYEKKGIPSNEAKMIFCENNFSGRTLACVSASTDETCKNNFGPFMPNFLKVPYNDLVALENAVKDPSVCAFFFEPIQGEAGIIIPSETYIQEAYNICKKHNVLFVADEIQTGLGRTGRMLCCDHSGVKPDLVLLGKALSGGFYPISAVLANNDVMLVLKPGEHGSTYGGNPLACKIAMTAVDIIIQEQLCEKAADTGTYFLKKLKEKIGTCTIVKDIRGKGLLCAIEFHSHVVNVLSICIGFKEKGLLAKPVHDKTVRFAPPLIISKEDIDICVDIIADVVLEFENKKQ